MVSGELRGGFYQEDTLVVNHTPNTSLTHPATCSPHIRLNRNAGFWLEAFFLAVAFCFLLAGDSTPIKTLSLVFVSIVLEAIPFMLLGSIIGGFIEVFISRDRMTSLLPKKGWHAACLAAGMGIIFPVCECAVVPVVRRLARKGLPASAAIAYLLGGPIVNPIVAMSTALAYKLDWTVVALRMIFGYVIAVSVALIIGRLFARQQVFYAGLTNEHAAGDHECSHEHHASEEDTHETASCGCGSTHHHEHTHVMGKILAAFRHAADDFLSVGHYLIIGAFIAALAQTFIDRKYFLLVSSTPVIPSVLMMFLAILLNLCSEADAFIAASFRNLLPLPAQLAFLLIGPMFDIKLLLMYQKLFQRRVIIALASLIFGAVLIAAVILEIL